MAMVMTSERRERLFEMEIIAIMVMVCLGESWDARNARGFCV